MFIWVWALLQSDCATFMPWWAPVCRNEAFKKAPGTARCCTPAVTFLRDFVEFMKNHHWNNDVDSTNALQQTVYSIQVLQQLIRVNNGKLLRILCHLCMFKLELRQQFHSFSNLRIMRISRIWLRNILSLLWFFCWYFWCFFWLRFWSIRRVRLLPLQAQSADKFLSFCPGSISRRASSSHRCFGSWDLKRNTTSLLLNGENMDIKHSLHALFFRFTDQFTPFLI